MISEAQVQGAISRCRARWAPRPQLSPSDTAERAAVRLEHYAPGMRVHAMNAWQGGAVRLFIERERRVDRSLWWSAYVHSLEDVDRVLDRASAPGRTLP